MNRILFCILMLAVTIVCGCSGKKQLGGKVIYSDDGSPVTIGSVFFTTPTFRAQGDIKQDGTYTVGSTGLHDGIPPGEYDVYIQGADKSEFKVVNGRELEFRTPLIDTKYQSPDTSGLTFTVDGSTKTFDIRVDRFKK